MDLQLKGKRVLITGSTAGIGYAIAETLAREGASVMINGRTEERVDQAILNIKKHHQTAELIAAVADLGTAQGCETIIQKWSNIDILINNFGIYEIKAFTQISDQDWLRLFEMNVLSGIRLSRHYIQTMLKQNWGRIIFVSSESALQTPVEMIHYGTTKTAQLAVARGLAEMTMQTGVTVNSILPGPTRTEGVMKFVESVAAERQVSVAKIEAEFFESLRPTSILKRLIEPKEIADFTAFLSSPLSAAINGTALLIDGGVVRSIV